MNQSFLREVEIVKDRIYWLASDSEPVDKNGYYFTVNESLEYSAINNEFGPLNIGLIHLFITQFENLIQTKKYLGKKFYVYSNLNTKNLVSSALLIGSYAIIKKISSSTTIIKKFSSVKNLFNNFSDCFQTKNRFPCDLFHCFSALEFAVKNNFVNLLNFDHKTYFKLKNVKKGYISPIIENKIYAFTSPGSILKSDIQEVLNSLRSQDVKIIIRLEEKKYDQSIFEDAGFEFIDLFINPKTSPSPSKIYLFLKILFDNFGKKNIAIHCDFGLGMTCSMIGLFLMQKYKMFASDVVAYMKMVRPGSFYGRYTNFIFKRQNHIFMIDENEVFNQNQNINNFSYCSKIESFRYLTHKNN
jgi:cell division cycle 14